MEHRYCKRKSVDIATAVYSRKKAAGKGRLTNISFDGAFLEIRATRRFPVGSVIEVEFSIEHSGNNHPLSLPAVIVHRRAKGMGLMFLHEDLRSSQVLQKVVQCKRVPEAFTESQSADRGNVVSLKEGGAHKRSILHGSEHSRRAG